MNLIKRAGLSLWSRKGKTLIMLGTFLAISAMVLGGVLIRDATAQAGEAAKRELGAEVNLGMDFDSMSSSGGPGTAPQVSADIVDKIGTSPLVEKYNYKAFNGARLLDGAETASNKPLTPGMGADFTLARGVLDSSLLPDFSSGKWELLSGEPITAPDKSRNGILVEERLAKKNKLKVGDRITLGENDPKGKRRADFTVKGIYRDPSDEPDPEYQQFPGDRLIVPAAALAALSSAGEKEPVQVGGATFRLKDPETFDVFKAEAKKTAGSALDDDGPLAEHHLVRERGHVADRRHRCHRPRPAHHPRGQTAPQGVRRAAGDGREEVETHRPAGRGDRRRRHARHRSERVVRRKPDAEGE